MITLAVAVLLIAATGIRLVGWVWAAAARDGAVAVFSSDVTTNVHAVAFSADGRTLMVGGVDCRQASCRGILGDFGPESEATSTTSSTAASR
jgi:hypothetical protein